jgi:hypothetical protein
MSFLVEPQNQGRWFVSGLASKPLGRFLVGLASKLVVTVSAGLASKSIVMVFLWFGFKTSGGGFLQFGLKTGGNSFSLFGLKTDDRFLGWASKLRWCRFSQFGPQNQQLWFGDLCLKITAMVSWFGPQNQAGFGLLVAPQNWWMEVGARHTLIFSGLLHVEASLARVSQSGLKTDEDATTGGTRGTIAEVASEAN